MSMDNTTWYVVENTPEKRVPELAKLLCIVLIRTQKDFTLFNRTLIAHDMIAYKDSYHKCFKRYPLKSIAPITAQDFTKMVSHKKEDDNMYRITWCTSKNPLGETRSIMEESKENVILWIMLNHDAMASRSAGYSVYLVDEKADLNETIWNWQPDKVKCFGKLFLRSFPYMVQLIDGSLSLCQDFLSFVRDEPVTMEPDKFAGLIASD